MFLTLTTWPLCQLFTKIALCYDVYPSRSPPPLRLVVVVKEEDEARLVVVPPPAPRRQRNDALHLENG